MTMADKKNTTRGWIMLAVLLAAFSAIAFVIPFERTTVFWIAYGFGIFSILFQVYIVRSSFSGNGDAKSRFYGFPIARIGVYYLAVQLVASIIEIALARIIPLWLAVIVNVILLVLALIGTVTVETMRDEIVRQDGHLKKDVSNIRELQSLSASIASRCEDEKLRKTLLKLADDFRYSDPVSSEKTKDMEADMLASLKDIQQAVTDGHNEGAAALCGKLSGVLAERNRLCSVSK